MSNIEQDAEIGRLVREHGERRREYLTLTAKLNRIGAALKEASEKLLATDADSYSENSYAAKRALEGIAQEVELRQLLQSVNEHVELTKQLKREQGMLTQYGVDR
jgi:hypothetical protein